MNKDNIIYGIRAIIEATNAQKPINKVYLQKGLSGELFKELEYVLRKKKINTAYVPVERLNKFTPNNHQGAVATISPVNYANFEALVEKLLHDVEAPLFLLLDQITDVRNFGAIIRTAECTGVHAIIVPNTGAAPINSDTIKTSAGAAFNIPIAKVNHLKDAIYYLKSSGIQIVAATEKGSHLLYEVNLKSGTALVMGAEDKGV